jgi:hypothetical protein
LSIGSSGTAGHPVKILSGQDAGHNGVVILNGANLVLNGRNYVVIDGEGSDASSQHIRVVNATIQTQSNTNPVLRYVEGNNVTVAAQYGSGGDFDHIYLHNEAGDSAFDCAARGAPGSYDQVFFENSHIEVNAAASGNGAGADGVQGCPGLTVRYSLIEGVPSGTLGTNHQDLIQAGQSWISVYRSVFKDGADSAFDYDCFNGSAPNHFRILNNVFIKARGGATIRFYGSGGDPCNSFSDIHIDNNTFVDHTAEVVSSYGGVDFGTGTYSGGNPSVSSTEIKNNVFYNDTGSPSVKIAANSGYTAADWHIDYNNVSGGSQGFDIDGAAYTQPHPISCTPIFAHYVPDSSPYSSTFATLSAGGYDLSPGVADTCLANTGTSLASLFSDDFAGTARAQGAAWDVGALERVGG